jgi:transcriptional regulator with XRE-family HTH domain
MARALHLHGFAREATFVSDIAQLSDKDIARATGAAPSTVRAWLAGTRTPTGERAERLVELSSLVERLARVIDPAYIAVWLRKPVRALDDDKPVDLIGRGDYRRVSRLISELEEMPVT